MANILGIPVWAVRTMLRYVVADFCLDCQVFVLTAGSHCYANYSHHKVVRLCAEGRRSV